MIVTALILAVGFIGSWLLFSGAIFQSFIELSAEDSLRIDRQQFRHIANVPPVSRWWWLLPPVKLYFDSRRRGKFRKQMFDVMTGETLENFVTFTTKAAGWQFVSLGSFCIALKETYELSEFFHLPIIVFVIVSLALVAASFINTRLRLKRAEEMRKGEHK